MNLKWNSKMVEFIDFDAKMGKEVLKEMLSIDEGSLYW